MEDGEGDVAAGDRLAGRCGGLEQAGGRCRGTAQNHLGAALAHCRFEQLADHPEGEIDLELTAACEPGAEAIGLRVLAKHPDQGALSDAGRTLDRNDGPAAAAHPFERREAQRVDLPLPLDQSFDL